MFGKVLRTNKKENLVFLETPTRALTPNFYNPFVAFSVVFVHAVVKFVPLTVLDFLFAGER